MEEITNVANFFKSLQVHLSSVWLEGCINWCKEENLAPNYTLKELQREVFEQWLILDLRDMEVPCLPPNLSSEKKYLLNDNYTLQLMKIVDISKPKYWQLQRIRNGIPKNLEQELESSKRVLQLTLTDGVQEVEAVEYKTIKSLNLNLSPGIKIRLIGPIQIRRGRLMLEERHVKVLSGEVEALAVSNAAENILAQYLHQPLNPTPHAIQENNLNDIDQSSVTDNTQFNQNFQRNNPVPQNQSVNTNIPKSSSYSNTGQINSSVAKIAQKKIENPIVFEDVLKIEQEIEMLMEVEKDFEQSIASTSLTKNRNNTPDLFDDMDIDFASIDIPDPAIGKANDKKQQEITNFFGKTETRIKGLGNTAKLKETPTQRLNNTTKSKETSIQRSDNTTKLKEIPIKILDNATKPKEPLVTINLSDSFEREDVFERKPNPGTILSPPPVIWSVDKLVKTIPHVTQGKFKIKAKFKSVIEKMMVKKDEFHLVVEVGDDTNNINLKIHNDVVADLIGYTAIAFMGFKEELSKNNDEVQRRMLEALKSLQTRLIALDDVLEVLVNVGETFPVLVKILSSTSQSRQSDRCH